ncbi:MAG: hypothetical protein JWP95_1788 [Actinotalea sp.]|nr:hypothetical protein [Actinotalea sp.]
MDEYPKVKLAAVQAAPHLLDRDRTVELACSLIREAGLNGAKIIGFPENFIAGHPYWYQFYNAYSSICRDFNVRWFKNAVEVPGDAVRALGDAAREAGAWVVIGVAEKDPGSYGTIYNTQLFFAPDGSLAGKHRKLVMTNAERLCQHNGDGSTLQTFPTEYGRLGGLICGEHFNSLARTALLQEGEAIHVASWPAFGINKGREWDHSMDLRAQFTAIEGRIFVISAASVWSEEMKDVLELDEAARARFKTNGGHSGIVGPNGTYIAGPVDDDATIVYAEADLAETVAHRVAYDITGHYQRHDVFTLGVDRSVRTDRVRTADAGQAQRPAPPTPAGVDH